MSSVFKLFANCIPVKGYSRSIIYDLQRNEFHFIPNSLFEILEKFDGESIERIKEEYNQEYNEVIDEYFDFLENKEIGFNTQKPDLFPPLNLKWENPSLITNAILCFNKLDLYDYKSVVNQLEELGCKAIQLRFFKELSLKELDNFLSVFMDKRVSDIEIILPFHISFNKKDLQYLFNNNVRLTRVLVFGSPEEKKIVIEENVGLITTFIRPILLDNNFCGVINPLGFTTNVKFFSEAVNHNTCLNKKISVDENGLIKNCPSMINNFGDINNKPLKEVAQSNEFQRIWNVKKDDVEICKDCEFRYMCLDCRAYLEDDEKDLKPLKCGYNPYISKWSTQQGYISAEQWLMENHEG